MPRSSQTSRASPAKPGAFPEEGLATHNQRGECEHGTTIVACTAKAGMGGLDLPCTRVACDPMDAARSGSLAAR